MASHNDELCLLLTQMVFAGDGVVLGMGMAVLAIKTWLKYKFHFQALKELTSTPMTGIADLSSLLERDNQPFTICNNYNLTWQATSVRITETLATKQQVKFPSWHKVRQEQQFLPKHQQLVIVRGRTQPKKSIEEAADNNEEPETLLSQQTDEKAVYVERTQTCLYNEWRGIFGWGYEWRGLFGWGSLREQVIVSRRKVPFVLIESHEQQQKKELTTFVHISLEDSEHSLPLQTVYHQLHPVHTSSYTLLQAMFGRRYPVGLLDEEKILPLGHEVTVVGSLGKAPDGKPVIKACRRMPVFMYQIEQTRDQLLAELAGGTKVLFWLGTAATTVAAGVLGYAIVRNWVKWKRRQQQRQQLEEESRQDTLIEGELEDVADIPDGELCVVCLLRRRRAAFIYCGHRVCCVRCAQRVEQEANPRCPVCRQLVTGIVCVFDS